MVLMVAFGHSKVNNVLLGYNVNLKAKEYGVHANYLHGLPLNAMGERPRKE
jgi:hypothetical protein